MSNTKHVTDNLSEYLDGTLIVGERARVEAHLATCPECRAELAGLRYVVTMTRALPAMRAPHSFTLSSEMAARARPQWRFGWLYASLRGFTAIAAVLLAMVCSADLLTVKRSGGFGAAAPAPTAISVPESSQTTFVTADQSANQTKASATVVVPAAPAGAAVAATSAPAPLAITSAPRQLPQTTLPDVTQTSRAAAPATGTPLGTVRSAAAVPTATAIIPPTNTSLPSPSPSLALTVTVTLYPTLPAPVIPASPTGFTEVSPFRAVEIGLLGALVLCVVATLFVRSARR
jgi:anti-sigma factor RsiW